MNRKITLPAADALAFVKTHFPGHGPGAAELADAGHALLQVAAALQEDGTYDVTVSAPSGVMVGWFLPDWLYGQIALPGGEAGSSLHLTLAYLGEASALSLDDQRKLIGVVSEVANRHEALRGHLNGMGTFAPKDGQYPLWVGVDVPGLAKLQADLVDALQTAGLPVSTEYDFHPHITVAYLPEGQEPPKITVDPVDFRLNDLTVAIAGAHHDLDLVDDDMLDASGYITSAYRPDLTKAVGESAEDRFTLGPWYVPNQLDAHDEWTDPESIQKALWGYVKSEDRRIRLQHNRDIVAGEWVEAMTWPFEVEVPLTSTDGTIVKYRYPAGTPFLGVQWEPWAWELVKAGKLRGYSIGGHSERVEVDLDGAPAH